jgi:hypothetical protein
MEQVLLILIKIYIVQKVLKYQQMKQAKFQWQLQEELLI